MNRISIEPMKINEALMVETLIKNVFDIFVGPDYSQEGVDTFYEFVDSMNIVDRLCNQMHKVLVAKDKEQQEIIGIIETRDNSHICLLFVDPKYHKQGIAKQLFAEAFNNLGEELTVNASPYAVPIYERLGFCKVSRELVKNGITYIPMIKE